VLSNTKTIRAMKIILRKQKAFDLLLAGMFIVLTAGFILSGYLYYLNYRKEYDANVTRQLSMISDLKVNELVRWRKERMWDAVFFLRNTEFSILAKKYLANTKDTHYENRVKLMIGKLFNPDEYDAIFLLDKKFEQKIVVCQGQDRTFSYISQRSMDSIRTGSVVFEDFYYNAQSKKIYLKILIPVMDASDSNSVIGTIALRIDPEKYLYPYIQRWPSDSKSGETLLIRRDGDDVVYLNQLRFYNEIPLKLRMNIEGNSNLPAVKAVIVKDGTMDGKDYRGVEVMAEVGVVPDSPWFIVTKMDTSEIYSSFYERVWTLVITIVLLAMSAAAFIGFAMKQNRVKDLQVKLDAEKALRATEEYLSITLNSIGDGVISTDAEGRVAHINPVAEKLCGWSSVEAKGKPLLDVFNIVNAETRQTVVNPVTRVLETNRIIGMANHTVLLSKDGNEYQIADSAAPIKDDAGKTHGVVLVFSDVTEKYVMEEVLRESEERFRTIIESTGEGIGFVNPQERFDFANRAAEEIFGVESGQLVGKNLHQFVTEEQFAHVQQQSAARVKGNKSVYELEIVRSSGEKRNIIVTAVPKRDNENGFVGTYGVFRDITERKLAEEHLKKSKEKYQGYFEIGSIGICVTSPKKGWVEVNDRLCQMLGYTKEELTALSWVELTHPDDLNSDLELFNQVVSGKRDSYELDKRFVRKDGSIVYTTLSVSCQRNPDGTVHQFLASILDITERKRTEEALRESEKKYRSLYNNTPVMLHSINPYGVLNSVSEYWLTTLGYERDEVIGKKSSEFLTDASRRYANETVLPEFMKTGICNNIEYQFVKKNGQIIDTLLTAVSEYDEKGNIARSVAVTIDITLRKQMEKALKESEKFLKDTQTIAELGTYSMDIASGKWRSSEILDSIFGIDADFDKSIDGWSSIIHPEWQKIMLEYFLQDVIGKKSKFDKEYKIIRRRDQSERWVHGVGELKFDEHQQPVTMVGTIKDITEQKHLAEALQESEQKFRTLFENMTEGVALHEMIYDGGKAIDYRIVDVNAAYENHTGLSQTKARGLLASELYQTQTPPYFAEFAAVANTGIPYAFETYFPPLDRHFHIGIISPAKGSFATIFEDISDRKRKEKELQEKNAELERFTYTVSHDLKSPLITIKGFSGGLLKDLARGRHDRFDSDLKRIADAANKMHGLLEDLLELSRIGRIINPPSEIALDILAQEVITLLSGPISNGNATVAIQAGLPVVQADRRRLFEVVQNLVENALKFMEDQPAPRIDIGMRENGGERIFFVRDNGKGIDSRYHETIFGLFNKLDASSKGSGIGLALARRIIEVHGGRIWVESEGNKKGSSFNFTLPSIQHTRKEKLS
jgi:PAS domain S-box-containing protein